MLELICRRLGFAAPAFTPITDDPNLHPGRAARVQAGGDLVGRLGELHPETIADLDLRAERIYVAEVAVAGLAGGNLADYRVTAPARFPTVERDIAVIVPAETPAADGRGHDPPSRRSAPARRRTLRHLPRPAAGRDRQEPGLPADAARRRADADRRRARCRGRRCRGGPHRRPRSPLPDLTPPLRTAPLRSGPYRATWYWRVPCGRRTAAANLARLRLRREQPSRRRTLGIRRIHRRGRDRRPVDRPVLHRLLRARIRPGDHPAPARHPARSCSRSCWRRPSPDPSPSSSARTGGSSRPSTATWSGSWTVFVAASVAFALVIQGFYKPQPLFQKARFADEILGGILGLVQAALILGALLIILDSFFLIPGIPGDAEELPFLRDIWGALDTSQIGQVFRETLIPFFFLLTGLFIPERIESMYPSV